jgi:hypothetical protein
MLESQLHFLHCVNLMELPGASGGVVRCGFHAAATLP